MKCLVDTGVLLRLINRTHAKHHDARNALRLLKQRRESICVVSQNLAEFWNVCTRPASARGGYGFSIETTDGKLRIIERLFVLLPEASNVFSEWRALVVKHRVLGVQVHDARLVAAMKCHGIAKILTENPADFARYDGISALTPVELVNQSVSQ